MKVDYLYCFGPDQSGNHAILHEAIAFILLGLIGAKGDLSPLIDYNFAGAETRSPSRLRSNYRTLLDSALPEDVIRIT
jgi:hypothetical protein